MIAGALKAFVPGSEYHYFGIAIVDLFKRSVSVINVSLSFLIIRENNPHKLRLI